MTSSIHYKVKTGTQISPNWSSIHFNGVYLSCFDLKQRIIYAEGMMKTEADATFDLLVTNQQNAEDYRDDGYSLHRNVSVIVKKIPHPNPKEAKRLFIQPGSLGPDWNKNTSTWVPPGMHADQAARGGASQNPNHIALGHRGEEDALTTAMQAASQYASAPRERSRGPFQPSEKRGVLSANSRPPPGYVCHRCKQGGHYIQFCPTNGDSAYDVARRGATTREERDREREKERERETSRYRYQPHAVLSADEVAKQERWLKPIEDPKAIAEGTLPTTTPAQLKGSAKFVYSSGFFSSTTTGAGQIPYVAPTAGIPPTRVQPQSSHPDGTVPPPSALTYQYSDPSSNFAPENPLLTSTPSREIVATLRPDLTCQLCKDYFDHATVIGCCFTSFCESCIKERLQSAGSCSSCLSTEVTVDDLQANVNLQKAVDTFLLEHPQIVRGAIKQSREAAAAAAVAAASGAPSQTTPSTTQQNGVTSSSYPPPMESAAATTNSMASFPPPPPPTTSHNPQPHSFDSNQSYPPPSAAYEPNGSNSFPPPPPPASIDASHRIVRREPDSTSSSSNGQDDRSRSSNGYTSHDPYNRSDRRDERRDDRRDDRDRDHDRDRYQRQPNSNSNYPQSNTNNPPMPNGGAYPTYPNMMPNMMQPMGMNMPMQPYGMMPMNMPMNMGMGMMPMMGMNMMPQQPMAPYPMQGYGQSFPPPTGSSNAPLLSDPSSSSHQSSHYDSHKRSSHSHRDDDEDRERDSKRVKQESNHH